MRPITGTITLDPKFHESKANEFIAMAESRECAARETNDSRFSFDKILEARSFRRQAYQSSMMAESIRKTGIPCKNLIIPDDVEEQIRKTVDQNIAKPPVYARSPKTGWDGAISIMTYAANGCESEMAPTDLLNAIQFTQSESDDGALTENDWINDHDHVHRVTIDDCAEYLTGCYRGRTVR